VCNEDIMGSNIYQALKNPLFFALCSYTLGEVNLFDQVNFEGILIGFVCIILSTNDTLYL
jgi:hypothetical protein